MLCPAFLRVGEDISLQHFIVPSFKFLLCLSVYLVHFIACLPARAKQGMAINFYNNCGPYFIGRPMDSIKFCPIKYLTFKWPQIDQMNSLFQFLKCMALSYKNQTLQQYCFQVILANFICKQRGQTIKNPDLINICKRMKHCLLVFQFYRFCKYMSPVSPIFHFALTVNS